jgi:hypothetical protein
MSPTERCLKILDHWASAVVVITGVGYLFGIGLLLIVLALWVVYIKARSLWEQHHRHYEYEKFDDWDGGW